MLKKRKVQKAYESPLPQIRSMKGELKDLKYGKDLSAYLERVKVRDQWLRWREEQIIKIKKEPSENLILDWMMGEATHQMDWKTVFKEEVDRDEWWYPWWGFWKGLGSEKKKVYAKCFIEAFWSMQEQLDWVQFNNEKLTSGNPKAENINALQFILRQGNASIFKLVNMNDLVLEASQDVAQKAKLIQAYVKQKEILDSIIWKEMWSEIDSQDEFLEALKNKILNHRAAVADFIYARKGRENFLSMATSVRFEKMFPGFLEADAKRQTEAWLRGITKIMKREIPPSEIEDYVNSGMGLKDETSSPGKFLLFKEGQKGVWEGVLSYYQDLTTTSLKKECGVLLSLWGLKIKKLGLTVTAIEDGKILDQVAQELPWLDWMTGNSDPLSPWVNSIDGMMLAECMNDWFGNVWDIEEMVQNIESSDFWVKPLIRKSNTHKFSSEVKWCVYLYLNKEASFESVEGWRKEQLKSLESTIATIEIPSWDKSQQVKLTSLMSKIKAIQHKNEPFWWYFFKKECALIRPKDILQAFHLLKSIAKTHPDMMMKVDLNELSWLSGERRSMIAEMIMRKKLGVNSRPSSSPNKTKARL